MHKYADSAYLVWKTIPKGETAMTEEEYLQKLMAGPVREDCPVRRTLELLSGKWRTYVIYELCKQPSLRFGELRRAIPRITNTMLTATLRDLEGLGIVRRGLLPVFVELAKWGEAYLEE